MKKHILDPKRLRRVPDRFSWVDHQLIRLRLLCGADSAAWALYLFLVTVGDEQGLSYYSDASVCSHLSLSNETLRQARRQLLERRLIAWEAPLYQVLCVQADKQADGCSGSKPTTPSEQPEQKTLVDEPSAMSDQQRHINGLALAEALAQIMEGGNS